jgi:hypothetical protein
MRLPTRIPTDVYRRDVETHRSKMFEVYMELHESILWLGSALLDLLGKEGFKDVSKLRSVSDKITVWIEKYRTQISFQFPVELAQFDETVLLNQSGGRQTLDINAIISYLGAYNGHNMETNDACVFNRMERDAIGNVMTVFLPVNAGILLNDIIKELGELYILFFQKCWATMLTGRTNYNGLDNDEFSFFISNAINSLQLVGRETDESITILRHLYCWFRSMMARCSICNIPARLKCSKCATIRYCSQECQKSGWGFHKTQCIPSGPFLEMMRHMLTGKCPVL